MSMLYNYLFIFHLFLLQVYAKTLICHRLECASQGVDWVCGSDGRNYPNLCELERIRCFGIAVHVRARGKCPGPFEQSVLSSRGDCTQSEWRRFIHALNKFWRKDYFRKPRPGADISLSIEKRVLHYNFARIDTNMDETVSNAEWKAYRMQHPIKRKCARDLIFKCDQDLDRHLDREEWMQCLYVSPSDLNRQWYHPKDSPKNSAQKSTLQIEPTESTDPKEPGPCQQVPKLSGNMSLDRFVYGIECNNQSSPVCTADKNLRFLQMLFSQFRTEMIFMGQMPSGGLKEGRRQAAAWKFKHLDSNGDGILQRPEWREFRQFIKYWDGVRKCGRSFFRRCDSNLDRQITPNEWHTCTVEAYEKATLTPQMDRNPFLYLLRPDN